MGMKRVIVHIDRLVLNGLGNDSPEAIALGLRQQLTTTLSARGATEAWTNRPNHVARLRVGPVAMSDDASPAHIGQSLAHAIGKGVAS